MIACAALACTANVETAPNTDGAGVGSGAASGSSSTSTSTSGTASSTSGSGGASGQGGFGGGGAFVGQGGLGAGGAFGQAGSSAGQGGASTRGGPGGGGNGGSGASTGTGGAWGDDVKHVTVKVLTYPGLAVADVPVATNDASGAVTSVVLTNVDGIAEVDVPNGGVVVAYPTTELYAQGVVDPPEGSTIQLGMKVIGPVPELDGFVDVTITGYPPETASIELHACGMASDPVGSNGVTTMVEPFDCGVPDGDILALARDAADEWIAWGMAKDVAAIPGGTVQVSIVADQTDFITYTASIDPILEPVAATVLVQSQDPYLLWVQSEPASPPNGTWSKKFPDAGLSPFVMEGVRTQGVPVRDFRRYSTYPTFPVATTFDPTTLAALTPESLDLSDPDHPCLTWSSDGGPVGTEMQIRFGANGGAKAEFRFMRAPTASGTFCLPDIPSEAVGYGAPSAAETWISCAETEGVTTWEQIWVFEGGPYASANRVYSSAIAP